MSEDRIELIIAEGMAAKQLLENPTFQNLLLHMKAIAITDWSRSAPGAPGLREEKYQQVRAYEGLEEELRTRVERAELENRRLDKQQAAKR